MSIDQEMPENEVKIESELENEAVHDEESHTEVGEHEYTIDELKQELEEAKQKAHENWDKAVRTMAEMENLKRRTQKDLEDAHKYFLGLQAATGDNEEVKKFREGCDLTIKQFETLFAKFNIVAIDPMGESFNAEQHQAMMMQEIEGAEPNTVVNVFQKGYLLNGRLLRPAMVVVAKAAEKPSDDNM